MVIIFDEIVFEVNIASVIYSGEFNIGIMLRRSKLGCLFMLMGFLFRCRVKLVSYDYGWFSESNNFYMVWR